MATLATVLSVSHSSTCHQNTSPCPISLSKKRAYHHSPLKQSLKSSINRLRVKAASEDDANGEDPSSVPNWARPDSDELPPWARDEAQKESSSSSFEVPYIVYLLASAVTAIAAIGSVFEYTNRSPVFGVLNSDSMFYAPVLGFFAFTGIPSAAFLWFKAVEIANKEAEEQDRRDGYL